MKAIASFLRVTITGGIIFLLPLVLIFIIIGKAISILQKLSAPLSRKLPDTIMGVFDGSILLAIILLILVCFIGGLIFRAAFIKKTIRKLEDKFLSMIPGYYMLKSFTADALGEQIEQGLVTVFVEDNGGWKIGYLTEEGKGYATVFFPEALSQDSGEVLILPISKVRKMDMPLNETSRSLKKYGRGLIDHL